MNLVEIMIFASGFLLFAILLSVFYGINAEKKSRKKLEELRNKGFKVVTDLKKQTEERTALAQIQKAQTMEEIKKHLENETPQPTVPRLHSRLEKFEPEGTQKGTKAKQKRNYRDLWK